MTEAATTQTEQLPATSSVATNGAAKAAAEPVGEALAGRGLYREILVPTDNSELCHAGMAWAIDLAQRWGSTVTGNHVYAARLHDDRFRQLEMGLPARFQTPTEIEKQRNIHDKLIELGLILISDSFIDLIEKRGTRADVKVERKLMEGIHFEQLAKDINRSPYDLVIMGAHGIGQVKHSQLGSVTARVARLITTDLLVMRQPERTLSGSYVVAVDGSAYSFVTLRKALTLAKEFGASVHVVSAFDPFYHYAAFENIRYVLSEQAGKVFKFEEQEELHNNIIDRGLKKVCEANLMRAQAVAAEMEYPITTEVLVGKPFSKIVDTVTERDADLLVIGRYGAHHVEGADLGSQSENLLRLATTNLLIVGASDAKPYDIPVIEDFEEQPLEWTDDALKLVLRAPPFAQGMAKASVEEFARAEGHAVVTLELLEGALKGLLPPSARHLMGLEKEDRKVAIARKSARSPIEEYAPHESTYAWTDGARARVEARVPAFVRPIAILAIERYAREKGIAEITEDTARDVAVRLGYEQPDGSRPEVRWTADGESRLARVPAFEREMVKNMVETMAATDGHATIDFAVADVALGKLKAYYEAAMEGQGGMFKDLAEARQRVAQVASNDGYALADGDEGFPGVELSQ
jgi:nucleotide-binding universal stress UspA family protein